MSERPKEIRQPLVLANFRRPDVKPQPSSAKRRLGNSEKHLAFIRQLPCCVCLKPAPSDPHHLKGGPAAGRGQRCFGRRATDQWTLPVCRAHHELCQPVRGEDEKALFQELGIFDVYQFAWQLYRCPKIVDMGMGVLLTNREDSGSN